MKPQEMQQIRAHLAEEGIAAEVNVLIGDDNDIRDLNIIVNDATGAEGCMDEVERVLIMTGWLNERSGGRLLDIVFGSEYTEPDTGARIATLHFEDTFIEES